MGTFSGGGWGYERSPYRYPYGPSSPGIEKPMPERETNGRFKGKPVPLTGVDDPIDPYPDEKLLAHLYGNFRTDLDELEELIASGEHFSEKDLKRLDKAVTLMKVGAKYIKKVLHRHGWRKHERKQVSV